MKTHELLRIALSQAGMARNFTHSGNMPGIVFPDGWFTRRLRASPDGPWSQLRLAASDLGVTRVELTLLLAGEADDASAAALYEQVDFLWTTGYRCHFSKVPDQSQLQLKAQVFISPQGPSDDEFLSDIPTVADADELATWLRVSFAACRKVLVACVKAR